MKSKYLLAFVLMILWGVCSASTIDEAIRIRLEPYVDSSLPLKVSDASVPQALVQFYAERNWAPLWDEQRFTALLAALRDLRSDGLDPDDYGYTLLSNWQRMQQDTTHDAEKDILATRAYLLALVHLHKGKLEPTRLFPNWNFDSRDIDASARFGLAKEAAESGNLADVFRQARPANPKYNMLRKALLEHLEIARRGGWPQITTSAPLKPGMQSEHIAVLRKRLHANGLLPEGAPTDSHVFDETLKLAVQRFQASVYLDTDGSVGRQTREALNIPVSARIDQIRANLERMRWYVPDPTRKDYVMVDIAGYRASYIKGAETIWTSRVQVGKEYRPTPVFRSEISYITLSPGWVVPPTILKQDMIPAIRKDPGYLARNRLQVFNAAGQNVSPGKINWSNPKGITIRQEPGPKGALGEVVIRFSNPYMVYLHDTPHQGLFEQNLRATSSGCIRVENIHELAVLLLDNEDKWGREAMQTVINERKTRNVTLPKKVPILLAYWTVDVDSNGLVLFRPDIYNRDTAIVAGLGRHP